MTKQKSPITDIEFELENIPLIILLIALFAAGEIEWYWLLLSVVVSIRVRVTRR